MIINNKCTCYHIKTKTKYLDIETAIYYTGKYPPNDGKVDYEVGICWGTKELNECSCGGDESKCDFYENKRKIRGRRLTDLESKIFNNWQDLNNIDDNDYKDILSPYKNSIKFKNGSEIKPIATYTSTVRSKTFDLTDMCSFYKLTCLQKVILKLYMLKVKIIKYVCPYIYYRKYYK